MQSRHFQHALGSGAIAFVHRWLPAQRPRAVVQVVHGMAEHGARYQRLARRLTAAGFAVYAQDLPGHGRSAGGAAALGHIADQGGWQATLGAIDEVRALAATQNGGVPLFMLGHSLGSFLLQDYVRGHSERLAGAIFSAGTGDMGPVRPVGLALLRVEALWRGLRHRSALAERLSFKEFNRRFRPNRTGFDWLSRDEAEVDRYVADPLCGFRCSCALWIDLLRAGGQLRDQRQLSRIRKNLPMLLINGSEDPVTAGEKGPRALERLYRDAGIADLSLRIYPGARHELLNETCRDHVTRDLLRWLEAHA